MKSQKTVEDVQEACRGLLSDEDFNKYLYSLSENEYEFALRYIKKEEQVLPKAIIVTNERVDGERQLIVAMFADGFTDEQAKKQIMIGFGTKLYEDKIQPLAIFLSSEAWMSSPEDLGENMKPSEDPEHREGIFIAGRTIDGRLNLSVAMIEKKNGVRGLGEPSYTEYGGKGKPDPGQAYLIELIYYGYAAATFAAKARS